MYVCMLCVLVACMYIYIYMCVCVFLQKGCPPLWMVCTHFSLRFAFRYCTQDAPDAKEFEFQRGELVFDEVHFSYDGQRQVLNGVSFTVPPGKTYALVGPSGSGCVRVCVCDCACVCVCVDLCVPCAGSPPS